MRRKRNLSAPDLISRQFFREWLGICGDGIDKTRKVLYDNSDVKLFNFTEDEVNAAK